MGAKKLVDLSSEQLMRVKNLARTAKISETEVIRRAIDAYGRDHDEQVAADKKRVMDYLAANPVGWADDPADFFRE
jgi:predicted transcriptional regulator